MSSLQESHELLMEWFQDNYSYSFVQELHIIYLHVYELKEASDSDMSIDRPLIYIDAIYDSYKYRYICAVEQFIKVGKYICRKYFRGNFEKFKCYFEKKYEKGKIGELRNLRNEFAHINNFHDIDIMPLDFDKVINGFYSIAIFYDIYIRFLNKKKNTKFIHNISY